MSSPRGLVDHGGQKSPPAVSSIFVSINSPRLRVYAWGWDMLRARQWWRFLPFLLFSVENPRVWNGREIRRLNQFEKDRVFVESIIF